MHQPEFRSTQCNHCKKRGRLFDSRVIDFKKEHDEITVFLKTGFDSKSLKFDDIKYFRTFNDLLETTKYQI